MSADLVTALGTLIAAMAAAVVSVIGALRVGRVEHEVKTGNGSTLGERVEQVHHEVQTENGSTIGERVEQVQREVETMNELTIGELGAEAETRRIDSIPADRRTPRESRHVATAADADPGRPSGGDGAP